jgi:large subunit ribosomal protein L5
MVEARLQTLYKETIVSNLLRDLALKNIMEVPRILKITINMGVGKSLTDKKYLEYAVDALTRIAGQRPVITKARKSIAAFKLRAGFPIGCKVTLRGIRMYEFLDRLVSIALPRVRDFRGLPLKGFDKFGNYSFGVKDHVIFPEVEQYRADTMSSGMDITLTIRANNKDHAAALLTAFQFPLKKQDSSLKKKGD